MHCNFAENISYFMYEVLIVFQIFNPAICQQIYYILCFPGWMFFLFLTNYTAWYHINMFIRRWISRVCYVGTIPIFLDQFFSYRVFWLWLPFPAPSRSTPPSHVHRVSVFILSIGGLQPLILRVIKAVFVDYYYFGGIWEMNLAFKGTGEEKESYGLGHLWILRKLFELGKEVLAQSLDDSELMVSNQ